MESILSNIGDGDMIMILEKLFINIHIKLFYIYIYIYIFVLLLFPKINILGDSIVSLHLLQNAEYRVRSFHDLQNM